MAKFTNLEYYEMIRAYILCDGNVDAARRLYETDCVHRVRARGTPEPIIPSGRTIQRTHQRLIDYGQFMTPNHAKASGRSRVSASIEDEVIDYFENDAKPRSTHAARRFGISRVLVWRILNTPGNRPRRKSVQVQPVERAEAGPRRAFCNFLISNPDINILWTDEAEFTSTGLSSAHDEEWWSLNYVDEKMDDEIRFSVKVWAGVIRNKIIGPIFIDGELKGQQYLEMLDTTIEDLIQEVPVSYLNNFYYQLDGDRTHSSHIITKFLNEKYGNYWIGSDGPVHWPTMSPDLTPCCFFLWPVIKELVYADEAETLEELKLKITQAFDKLRNETSVLNDLQSHLLKRANLCLEKDGQRFEKYLRKCEESL
uniref:DUF4817 domain-containing protein n=1 Tax=Heliothis virescens TaxID=7102 RepID=A0A2A4K448_HELVI